MLQIAHSRERTRRLAALVAENQLDAIVCGVAAHVYYVTTYLQRWVHQAAVIVFVDGHSCLIKPRGDAVTAADEIVDYDAAWLATLRPDQPQVVAALADDALRRRAAKRVGIDPSSIGTELALIGDRALTSVAPDLYQMRRRKDPDELALIAKAVRCCEAMFRRAREIIEPGVCELDVFNELHAAAVRDAGEPLTALLGNDYACGAMGGPPRSGRRAKAGEIYIIDAGPAYRGYFGDTTRSFSVDRSPSDAQMRAWESIVGALRIVESIARPGVRCREIVTAVEDHFRQSHRVGLAHHLGHGVGLEPHEYPHLNPRWDDVLQAGEVISCEPALYDPALAGGIRLENQYVVTSNGLQNLLDFPLDLA